ncbi:hypothetical protein SUGI_1516660 [Cryptomeria japonica]|uniref:Guanylate cyclase domain-containing protein n=1 Tax=Cryptomeria japonica TaxID=3369 RepID=A0AAD3NTU6_CRYJA|nr:hypothetical protein SUGI_1516660 [Cryptomeria japonica]
MLKRRQYAHAIDRSTFSDASQLIEAKVSLEHQRQQQETLLLSVLPAYVAEQVKRNMLKKTTATTMHSKDMDTQEHVNAMGTCLQASSWPTPVQQASSAVASTEPKPANQDPLASQQQQQAASSNLNSNSNLHDGAAAERIALDFCAQSANRTNTHPLPSSSRNQFPGAGAGGNNSHLMGFHQPVSNFPAQISIGSTSTARRGFNELYIRTYNNVSLLYGDIVGFTRLCTQLSSSQLVRGAQRSIQPLRSSGRKAQNNAH